ncbi:hypothetical protein [Frankia sp. AgB32]|uniref:hypothetical protein n=1 Tax=Frankia sp. AgB32 TaxID=631119 RepID=UPI002010ABB1|nr:hypothetical protein [Frankia sp. AgB32]MCK9898133.1 hypothetical protein [Frankia sp. AgB32]
MTSDEARRLMLAAAAALPPKMHSAAGQIRMLAGNLNDPDAARQAVQLTSNVWDLVVREVTPTGQAIIFGEIGNRFGNHQDDVSLAGHWAARIVGCRAAAALPEGGNLRHALGGTFDAAMGSSR